MRERELPPSAVSCLASATASRPPRCPSTPTRTLLNMASLLFAGLTVRAGHDRLLGAVDGIGRADLREPRGSDHRGHGAWRARQSDTPPWNIRPSGP